MKRLAMITAAGAVALTTVIASPAASAAGPDNWMPCQGKRDDHCTYAGQFMPGRYPSFWHGATQREHWIGNRRANIREVNGFREHGYQPIGRQQGHPSCWDNGHLIICQDGARL